VTIASRSALGDSHNFGRHVSRRAGRIRKPRPVLWEWLLLSAQSPLRRLLAKAAEGDGLGHDAFDFLPDLGFRRHAAPFGGEVEAIALRPLPRRLATGDRRALARLSGRATALFSWLGLTDLHWENLVLGMGPRGRVIFAPLDVEMILGDLSLPTETKLVADADPEYAAVCRHAAGMRRLLPYLGKPIRAGDLVAMAGAYRAALELLDRRAQAIAAVFMGLPALRRTPIRVLLRATGDYVRARSGPVWPPLLDAEAEQLARGDIPYFFRLYGQPGIHFFADASLRRYGRLPRTGDVPRLSPLLPVGRALRSAARDSLRDEGLFALLGAFDHPSFEGTYETDELDVTFKPRTLVIRGQHHDELSSRRDLSAFVGSLYLPCRCGEVRSVYVPELTACEAAPQSPRARLE
jgi:hypothetical protein